MDADFWARPAELSVLAPYLQDEWREYLRLHKDGTPAGDAFTKKLPESVMWRPGLSLRQTAGSDDPLETARTHLDDATVETAILNPGIAGVLSAVASPFYAAALARAANDWTRSWLDADARFLGSIVIGPADAELAVSEVRRWADDKRMVQILLAYPKRLLGHRSHWPLFEVAEELGLPVAVHAGGGFAAGNRGVSGVGHPTSPLEYEVSWIAGAQPHLTSMICEGAFDRYPRLKLVLSGFGVAWLPSLLWRLSDELASERLPLPRRLARRPGEYLADQVRFTTVGMEVGAQPQATVDLLSLVGAELLLMYGSGPARGGVDPVEAALDAMPAERREGILSRTAQALYS